MIVGLGNPGPEYKNTRHNIGFLVIDRLRKIKENNSSSKFKQHSDYAISQLDDLDKTCLLVKPLTYMNLSGRAVKKLTETYNIPPNRILVIHDDLDIPFGRMKLKYGGGLAGHRGLKSIAGSLGTRDFFRLRIGIGRPDPREGIDIREYVLSSFLNHELQILPILIDGAIKGIYIFLDHGYEKGLNFINGFRLANPHTN